MVKQRTVSHRSNPELENIEALDVKREVLFCVNKAIEKASPEILAYSLIQELRLTEIIPKALTVFVFGKASRYILIGLANAMRTDRINGFIASNVIPDNLKLKAFKSSHPLPNQESLKAGEYALELSKELGGMPNIWRRLVNAGIFKRGHLPKYPQEIVRINVEAWNGGS